LVSSNPELAEQFIQKLSSIYRYVLEYREIEFVDLISEIAFVKDYFYLQQIRDEDKISLTIEVAEPANYKILPMSLQLLVENAIKHNAYTRENPLKILIRQNDGTLEITNNLQKKLTIGHSSKIGLKNLGERTKFITKKELQVIATNDEFKVIVPLIPSLT
jgi:LytS/YehU family sensor histidine kinase